jgi:hypothetical protein
MTRAILSYASLLLLGISIANADPIGTLDVSQLQIGEEVLGYFDAGVGSFGSGPGPNLGITFTSDFVTVPLSVVGPAEQLTSASGIMDVSPAYSGGVFSFYDTNMSDIPGSVVLYSGLDGTGSLLGSLTLPAGDNGVPQGFSQIDPFESVVFNGNGLVFRSITFGFQVIPEPSSISLLWIVLAAILIARRSFPGRRLS